MLEHYDNLFFSLLLFSGVFILSVIAARRRLDDDTTD